MKTTRLKIGLAISLTLNVVIVAAVAWVIWTHGGWPFLMAKLGLVENNYSSRVWYRDKIAVFQAMPRAAGEIVFVGDSLTNGYPWAEAFDGHPVRVRALDGDTSDGVLARATEALRGPPSKVFLMIGINDLLTGERPETVLTNVRAWVAEAQRTAPTTHIYIESVLPLPSNNPHPSLVRVIPELNRELMEIAKHSNVSYIDLYKLMADDKGFLKPSFTRDSIHINAAAYKVWRDQVTELVVGASGE